MAMTSEAEDQSIRRSRKLLQEIESRPPPPPPLAQSKRTGNLLDTQIVIVLGAVLCVLICAVWLHSVVRCMVRRNRRQPVATVIGGGDDESAAGLDAKTISALPVVPASVDGHDRQAPVGPVALSSNSECIVCLQEFGHGERMKLLPNCGHGFHVDCIGAWLMSHSSCPICRHRVLEPPSPSRSSRSSPSPGDSSSSVLLSSPLMRQFQHQLNSQQRSFRRQQQQQQPNPDLVLQHNRFAHQLRQFHLQQEPSSSALYETTNGRSLAT
ncbi:RING-H2 finger protein ATL72 [Selaginella moellendorffii]|uniref:RING-H2 finger protein ATL72 n=1 Tax=Selaginella moellendorffii TaxID=88036 RepID=UPI000D1C58DA|nr:RING-H2 finger protein ATL72 [Selaginella moellendorffii]|eukprot:XP_024517756.1 RING-H2 finger protein ATL72 [Selaginella moellendorffii]